MTNEVSRIVTIVPFGWFEKICLRRREILTSKKSENHVNF